MSYPQKVSMPGQVWGLATPNASGPLFVTSSNGHNLSTIVLSALDLTGTVLWRREFGAHPGPPRVSDSGTVWIAHSGSGGHTFSELDAAGSVLRSITPEHASYERLGGFVLLPDGICAAWLPAAPSHVVPPGRTARLARYDENAACRWSTPVVVDKLAHSGVVETSADSDWQVGPMQPWTPRTIEVSHLEPLLVSGNRIAATSLTAAVASP